MTDRRRLTLVDLDNDPAEIEQSGLSEEMFLLRKWQAERLSETYADLQASKRYAMACDFFLNDLYAPRDFSQRDADGERMYHFMRKFVPERLIHSLTLAIELNRLTAQLDRDLLAALVNELGMKDTLTADLYAQAYHICDNYKERARQIDLIVEVGKGLSWFARLPLINLSLRLTRNPFGEKGQFELQEFLERGLTAFKHMKGTKQFLNIVKGREYTILDNIFANETDPFTI